MKDWYISDTAKNDKTHIYARGDTKAPRRALTQGEVVELLNQQHATIAATMLEIERLRGIARDVYPERF